MFQQFTNLSLMNSILYSIILYYSFVSIYTINTLGYKGFGSASDEMECNITYSIVLIFTTIIVLVSSVIYTKKFISRPNKTNGMICMYFALFIMMLYGLSFIELLNDRCDVEFYKKYKNKLDNQLWTWINMINLFIVVSMVFLIVNIIYRSFVLFK